MRRVVLHPRKDNTGKVDAACPAAVVVVALIAQETPAQNYLPVQPKDVDGTVVAARTATPLSSKKFSTAR